MGKIKQKPVEKQKIIEIGIKSLKQFIDALDTLGLGDIFYFVEKKKILVKLGI